MEEEMEIVQQPPPSSTSTSSPSSSSSSVRAVAPEPAKIGAASASGVGKKVFSQVKDFTLSSTQLLPPLQNLYKQCRPYAAASNEVISNDRDPNPAPSSSQFVTPALKESQKSFTENGAPTFNTSDDSRLDFYFGIMETTPQDRTLQLFSRAWSANPVHALRLLANLRDITKGKGIRMQYQQCLYWLYEHHPSTLFHNLAPLVRFGYWKDVLHFLMVVLFDGYIHPYFVADADPEVKRPLSKAALKKRKRKGRRGLFLQENRVDDAVFEAKQARVNHDAEKRAYNQKILDYYRVDKLVSQLDKNVMLRYRLKFAREKFQVDEKYREFHLKISQLFAKQLHKDIHILAYKNSLAGKWSPTLEGHFDKFMLIATTIALELSKLVDGGKLLESKKSNAVIVYLARKAYNKNYCIPLRRHIPERLMSQNQWNRINYSRVPAKSMAKHKKAFIAHDKERFEKFLKTTTVVGGATLKPVEIICEVMSLHAEMNPTEALVLEKQWDFLVAYIARYGRLLREAVCVCSVSGSMVGTPLKAALGLTLLTMTLSSPPWNSICITFSERPEIFSLGPELSLAQKLDAMKSMACGGNTNLQSVFEKIVEMGVKYALKDENMPKILFIFSDMEFDAACPGSSSTNYQAATHLFASKGYSMPMVVFWNLRESKHWNKTSTPAQKNELGVILLSGFSAQSLSFILETRYMKKMCPLQFMLGVVSDGRYTGLDVYD